MPTLIELDTIEENVHLCQALNLNFIELNMNLPEYQPNKIDTERLAYLKDKNNIFYTIHLPEEFDIAGFNDDIRKGYEKIFYDTIKIAFELNTPIINMHMNLGVYFTMPTERIYLYEKYKVVYRARIKSFSVLAKQLLGQTGIKLAIENTGIYDIGYIREAVDELIKNDEIVLTWDIGHDFSSGHKDSDYILKNRSKLKHMHLHDAIGKNNHLPLFTGEIDICNRMEIARQQGCYCVIETKTVKGLKESISKLNEYEKLMTKQGKD
jgi:sugar phosphate isomerase/epimerase